jgi:hypothetical protein
VGALFGEHAEAHGVRVAAEAARVGAHQRVGVGDVGDAAQQLLGLDGMGDLVTSLTWAAYDNAQTGIAVDLIGKVKWGTADEKKGLGTGKNDVSAQADIYKTLGKTAIFATLGYKVYGDPSGIDFKNVGYGGLGVSHRLSDLTSGGLTWDYRPKVTTNGKPTNEITAFMTRKFSDATKMQFYLVKGLSDGSPDWGGGLVLSHAY